MKRRSALPTLADAIDWLSNAWVERETPLRLHEHTHDGWGLSYAPAFARRLDSTPMDKHWATQQRTCHHLRASGNQYTCPDCSGTGTYDVTLWAWRWPMWRAMTLLERDNRAAHDVIVTLAINAFHVRDTLTVLAREGSAITEAGLLGVIRRLYQRYQLQPAERGPSWLSKSDAQRNAEGGMLMVGVA